MDYNNLPEDNNLNQNNNLRPIFPDDNSISSLSFSSDSSQSSRPTFVRNYFINPDNDGSDYFEINFDEPGEVINGENIITDLLNPEPRRNGTFGPSILERRTSGSAASEGPEGYSTSDTPITEHLNGNGTFGALNQEHQNRNDASELSNQESGMNGASESSNQESGRNGASELSNQESGRIDTNELSVHEQARRDDTFGVSNSEHSDRSNNLEEANTIPWDAVSFGPIQNNNKGPFIHAENVNNQQQTYNDNKRRNISNWKASFKNKMKQCFCFK